VGEPAASIGIQSPPSTIDAAACEVVQLKVELRDKAGRLLEGRHPIWTSSSPAAYVGETGSLYAVTSGHSTITASTGLVSSSVMVTVIGQQPGRFGCDG
jgi:hypothetical protein